MSEKYVSLDFPPGLQNNGTAFQSKGRWHVGNLVRFYQGTVRPVGGWVKRTTTGATISGTPNAAISWTLNDGTSYLAIGTTTHLYVVNSANVVYDVTPTSIPDPQPYLWQLETFGSYLIAVNSVTAYSGSANRWRWTGDVAVPAATFSDPTTGIIAAPQSVFGVVSTPERFLVLLRGSDPPGTAPPAKFVS